MLYEIYNGLNNSLMSDDPVVEADSAREALQKHLGDEVEFKAWQEPVLFKTTPISEKPEGSFHKYRKEGRVTWWGIKPKNI
jgi:hypothetical protein